MLINQQIFFANIFFFLFLSVFRSTSIAMLENIQFYPCQEWTYGTEKLTVQRHWNFILLIPRSMYIIWNTIWNKWCILYNGSSKLCMQSNNLYSKCNLVYIPSGGSTFLCQKRTQRKQMRFDWMEPVRYVFYFTTVLFIFVIVSFFSLPKMELVKSFIKEVSKKCEIR